jgi:Flp pilus assembly protein TadD
MLYMSRDFAGAEEVFLKIRAPVPHMRVEYGAALAQLDRIDEAREAIAAGVKLAPPHWSLRGYISSMARMCRRQEEVDVWLEGYRKVGIDV